MTMALCGHAGCYVTVPCLMPKIEEMNFAWSLIKTGWKAWAYRQIRHRGGELRFLTTGQYRAFIRMTHHEA